MPRFNRRTKPAPPHSLPRNSSPRPDHCEPHHLTQLGSVPHLQLVKMFEWFWQNASAFRDFLTPKKWMLYRMVITNTLLWHADGTFKSISFDDFAMM